VNARAAVEARATASDMDATAEVTAEVHVTGFRRATDTKGRRESECAEEL